MFCFRGDLDAIERFAYEFIEDCSKNNVAYVEVRYMPHKLLGTELYQMLGYEGKYLLKMKRLELHTYLSSLVLMLYPIGERKKKKRFQWRTLKRFHRGNCENRGLIVPKSKREGQDRK
jgi:Adenosine deaminase